MKTLIVMVVDADQAKSLIGSLEQRPENIPFRLTVENIEDAELIKPGMATPGTDSVVSYLNKLKF